MSRREQLENIIIGTLMESNSQRNYFDECKAIIPEMFSDPTNRKLFTIISDMNAAGRTDTDPCSIFKEYDFMVADILPRMLELCTDYSFIHLKMEYNERRYIDSCITGNDYRGTTVQFVDYIKQFLSLIYS